MFDKHLDNFRYHRCDWVVYKKRTCPRLNIYKLTNVTFFAALLKEVLMGYQDALLPDPLMGNRSVKRLIFGEFSQEPYNDIFILHRSLALHGNENLEEQISKLFNLFLEITRGTGLANFGCVCKEDRAAVENIVQIDIFPYNIKIIVWYRIGELATRSVGKRSKTVRLLLFNSHSYYVSNINALFKGHRCPSCDQFIKSAHNLVIFDHLQKKS